VRSLAIVAALALGSTHLAFADGDDLVLVPSLEELEAVEALDRPDDQPERDDELLVRSASRVSVPLAEAPGIVTVIRASDLRAMGARTLYEALRYSPALDVTRDSFGFYHVAVRGRKVDTEVLVLLDGQRLNSVYDGHILYEIPISLVERIEILRGPGSSLYGTNAFAGVISIYTRKRSGHQLQLQLATSGGDRNELQVNSFFAAGYGGVELGSRFRLYVSVEVARDGGPELLVPEDSLTRNRFDPDTLESQSRSCDNQPVDQCPDTAYTSLPRTTIRASTVVESRRGLFVDGDNLSTGVHAIHVDKGPFIGEFDTLTPDSRLRQSRVLANGNYELALRPDRAMTLSFGSNFDLTDVDREIQVSPDGFKENVDSDGLFPDGQLKRVDFTEIMLKQDVRFQWSSGERNTLVVGAEVENTRIHHFAFETNYDEANRRQPEFGNHFDFALEQDGESRTVLSVYAEDLYSTPFGVRLVAGGRFDHYNDFGAALSPRAGAVWRLGDISLKLFYGWAFRAPTFEELYDQTRQADLGQYVGNSTLEASRIKTLEGAVLYTLSLDDLSLEVTVTGSHSSISDSIDRAPLDGLNNVFLNTSDVESNAASADVRAEFLRRRLSLFTNVSWQSAHAEYAYVNPDEGLNFVSDTELLNVPRVRLNAGARGQLTDRYSAGLLAEVGGTRENNERTPLEKLHSFDYSPYSILQIYVQAENVWNGLFVRLAARNLTNTQVNDEPFRPNRMPLGIPRDRLRIDATLGMDF